MLKPFSCSFLKWKRLNTVHLNLGSEGPVMLLGSASAGEVMLTFLCRGLFPKAVGDSACQVHTHSRRTQLLAPAPSHTLHHWSLSDDFCQAWKLASITDQFITSELDQAPALQVTVAPATHESTFNIALKFSCDCFELLRSMCLGPQSGCSSVQRFVGWLELHVQSDIPPLLDDPEHDTFPLHPLSPFSSI